MSPSCVQGSSEHCEHAVLLRNAFLTIELQVLENQLSRAAETGNDCNLLLVPEAVLVKGPI